MTFTDFRKNIIFDVLCDMTLRNEVSLSLRVKRSQMNPQKQRCENLKPCTIDFAGVSRTANDYLVFIHCVRHF